MSIESYLFLYLFLAYVLAEIAKVIGRGVICAHVQRGGKTTFFQGDKVRFSASATGEKGLQSADREVRQVTAVRPIADSLFSILNFPVEYPVVGHHQWVTLDDGNEYSGAWLLPEK